MIICYLEVHHLSKIIIINYPVRDATVQKNKHRSLVELFLKFRNQPFDNIKIKFVINVSYKILI